MKIVISSGHGKFVRGAVGFLDEVEEARRVVAVASSLMRALGHEVVEFNDDVSTSQQENLDRIVDFHNSQTRDLDISVHFNAFEETTEPMGTEVWYLTQEDLASSMSTAIAAAAQLPDRGAKQSSSLAFLNGTSEPAILIEVCFVDSSSDADAYDYNFKEICKAIAEVIDACSVVSDEG